MDSRDEALAALVRLGLTGPSDRPTLTPLTGGVSSDIWKADLADRTVCVKRALPRLRVAQVWEAPVERNVYEWEWMRVATRAVPGSVPEPIAQDAQGGVLVMDYLDPARHPLWKAELREGRADAAFAAAVGRTVAAIHSATAHDSAVAARFATDRIFYDIRLEPYLIATGSKWPQLAPALADLARRTADTRIALVHGDVSPKNILVGPEGPIFLDAECAWYGDPAFDIAFCVNHLLLKCLWTPAAAPRFLEAFSALADTYLAGVDWEARDALESRAASLLPALLLARVDGKSPVEYLSRESERERVRRVAAPLIARPPARLSETLDAWKEEIRR